MANTYDIGLFSELEDVMARDTFGYEESSDVSSFYGDISKQHLFDTSSLYQVAEVANPVASDYHDNMDSLLHKGNMLLDQLIAGNHLDLGLPPHVDLEDVDALIRDESSEVLFYQQPEPMYKNVTVFGAEIDNLPSPQSTLPSEPSSPVNLFDLDYEVPVQSSPVQISFQSAGNADYSELDQLLESLLDDGSAPCSSSYQASSPASSYASDYSCYQSPSPDGTWEDQSFSESLSSPVSSEGSPAPLKATAAKRKSKSTPYSKLPSGRKEKKKQQNKEAAIRYRQKKKSETMTLAQEEEQLKTRNDELKSDVLNLEREIMCMKELLSDVFNIHSF